MRFELLAGWYIDCEVRLIFTTENINIYFKYNAKRINFI